LTDEEIVTGLRRREPAALNALIDQYAALLYALVDRVLAGAGGPPDVEECVSDTMHAAWERIGQFDRERAPLKTWLLILAKYKALDRRRALLRDATPVVVAVDAVAAPASSPEAELVGREERAEVQAALGALAPVDRTLVYGRYFLGERVDALAEALGLTRQAADNRLWRARRQLAEYLSGKGVATHD
jgi:RNA polymerase sigma-70 factor, ECF subfamily